MNVLPLLPHQSDPGPRHHSVTRHKSRVITHHVSWHHTSSHQWWFVSIITCHAGHHMTSQMPDITGHHHRCLTSQVITTCHWCHRMSWPWPPHSLSVCPDLLRSCRHLRHRSQSPAQPSQPLSHLLHPHPAPQSRSRSLPSALPEPLTVGWAYTNTCHNSSSS